MTSSYRSQYPLLHIDLNLDHDHQPTSPFTLKPPQVASSSSSHSLDYPPVIIKTNQDEGSHYYQGLNYPFQNQEEAHTNASHDGSRESPTVMMQGNYGRIKLSISQKGDGVKGNRGINEEASSAKLMSSRIRMMRKMVGSDHIGGDVREDHKDLPTSPFQRDDNNNNSIRVCADCNTTKTPLWRSGPKGPKSLCNACGIRQRKARRAMVAAAGENGTALAAKINNNPAALKTKLQKKVKKVSNGHLPFKKRCKFSSSSGRGRKKLSCYEDLSIILSKNSTYQQVFPQDEKEAAILLMALSYGLVHG